MRLTLEACEVNLDSRVVVHKDKQLKLTTTDAKIMRFFASRPGRVVSREELYRVVWGHSKRLETRALDIAILRLRKKVESTPRRPSHILSEYGEGYSFVPLAALRRDGSPPENTTPPQRETPNTNIGPRPNTFWGRTDELQRLRALHAAKKGFISVLGPPGIGKTRLVRHWARQMREDRLAESLFFCDLARCETVEDIHRTLIGTLDIATPDASLDEPGRLRSLGRSVAERKIDIPVEAACSACIVPIFLLLDIDADRWAVLLYFE